MSNSNDPAFDDVDDDSIVDVGGQTPIDEQSSDSPPGSSARGKHADEDDLQENDLQEFEPSEPTGDDGLQQLARDREDSSLTPTPHGPIAPPPITRNRHSGPPAGIRRADHRGLEIIDALAGRASVFGFGFAPIIQAIQDAAEHYLGDGSAFDVDDDTPDSLLHDKLRTLLGTSSHVAADSILLCSSADMAVESAIGLARRWQRDKRFRTVALLDSDHGRSGTCLTASGRPDLHEGYGPMMAGFSHVPAGDLKALRSAVDDQTACILLSPIELAAAARPLDADYLVGVRELCNETGVLMIIDETQLALGASGQLFTFASIADVMADIVILSGGLFAGLPGGLLIASQRVSGVPQIRTGHYPLLAAVAAETISAMSQQQLPDSAADTLREFAVALAEQIAGFEFVRDVHATGMTIGIETDIEAGAIVRAAAERGLRIAQAGETAIRIQPPLVLSDDDRAEMLSRVGETMEAIERQTTELSV